MTPDIALVLSLLAVIVILFVTEKVRVDLVALLLLGTLVVLDLVSPETAVSGFSNPAVVTVWAVFILSGGLARTGIAARIGAQVLRLAGKGEARLIVILMATAGLLSAFMNNIGVAAMFLPVVLDIARRTRRPPSRLLLPMVFGSLLGGMTTLISTPTNILISDALAAAGRDPFGLFDYTPPGLLLLVAGILFMLLIGRRLLPDRHPDGPATISPLENGEAIYGLAQRLAIIHVPKDSPLAGRTLAESRIGQALGINILAITRRSQRHLAPSPDAVLQGEDKLLVSGRLDQLTALRDRPNLLILDEAVDFQNLISSGFGLAVCTLTEAATLHGQTLAQLQLRQRYDLNVLAIAHNGRFHRTNLQDRPLAAGDHLLLHGPEEKLHTFLQEETGVTTADLATVGSYQLEERLLLVTVPEYSALAGRTLAAGRLANTYGLTALASFRHGEPQRTLGPDDTLQIGDVLVVEGDPDDLRLVRGLQQLTFTPTDETELEDLDTGPVALVEAVLSPNTMLVGKTLRQIDFRDKYGLSVLAIWSRGRAYRTNLGDRPLRFGDGLLLFGPRHKIMVLGREPDFIVLQPEAQEALRTEKAPLAALIMIGVIAAVLVGWLPIAIAAIIGATLMVLSGCLSMDEAYRAIEWKAVFLIAGMLPLGSAMQQSGTAEFLANGVIALVGSLGPHAVLAGLFLLTLLATQFMPNPVVAVLLAPIALTTAADLGVSPYPLLLAIAFAASSSFLSPVGHPANVLIMGPGGYRFGDYLKAGLPLTLVMLVVVVTAVPLLWPF